MPLKYIQSSRGNPLLMLQGHLFMKQKQFSNGKITWKCTNYSTTKCRARVHTKNDEVTDYDHSVHNHVANCAKMIAREVVGTMKERAATTTESTFQIISDVIVGVPEAITGQLPGISNLKRTIQRVRQRKQMPVTVPTVLTDLVIPEEYQRSYADELFLLHDSGVENQRIIVFSTTRNLKLLAQSEMWYAVGTFKTIPPLFAQLYTIHAIQFHTTVPVLFALLPSKTQETYSQLMVILKNLNSDLAPVSILTDFEQNAMQALQTAFPQAKMKGCFLHINQWVYQQVQHHGLQYQYENDANFALSIRMLPALALVPLCDIEDAYDTLIDSKPCPIPQEAQAIADGFEDAWIGRPTRGNRRPPLFPMELWNGYEEAVHGQAKLNQAIEEWHKRFLKLAGDHHSSIWNFIDVLKREQSLNETQIGQFLDGVHVQQRRKRHCDNVKQYFQCY